MELQQVVTVFSTTVPDEKLCVGATRLDFSTPTTPEILSATAVALPAARPEQSTLGAASLRNNVRSSAKKYQSSATIRRWSCTVVLSSSPERACSSLDRGIVDSDADKIAHSDLTVAAAVALPSATVRRWSCDVVPGDLPCVCVCAHVWVLHVPASPQRGVADSIADGVADGISTVAAAVAILSATICRCSCAVALGISPRVFVCAGVQVLCVSVSLQRGVAGGVSNVAAAVALPSATICRRSCALAPSTSPRAHMCVHV